MYSAFEVLLSLKRSIEEAVQRDDVKAIILIGMLEEYSNLVTKIRSRKGIHL